MSVDRKAPGRRADYRAFVTLGTRWGDNDMYGHMNNVVHYALFDTAVNGWAIGQGAIDPAGEAICIVVESGCRYHAPLAFPEPVTAGLRVGRIGTSSIRYEIGLFGGDADIAAAEGHFVHVQVGAVDRRPRPLTPALRRAAEGLVPPEEGEG